MGRGGMGWLGTDNRAISVQLNLTGTGTELGNTIGTFWHFMVSLKFSLVHSWISYVTMFSL